MTEGSLSLILDEQQLKLLLKKTNITKGTGSTKVDSLIREYIIKTNIDNMKDIFKDNEIKILKYAFDLTTANKVINPLESIPTSSLTTN